MADNPTSHQQGFKAGTQGKGADANPHKDPSGFFGAVVNTLTRDALNAYPEKDAAAWEKGRQEGAKKK